MTFNSQDARVDSHPAPVLVGTSKCAEGMRLFAERAGQTEHTILLQGETGVGKDRLAELVHHFSPRRGSFVRVNCAGIPETLLESELFGHVKGAFTGAYIPNEGLIRHANGGTLFLDEIGDMSPVLQAKILHFVEKKTFRPIGGVKELAANVRIMAASNIDLGRATSVGKFRSDLYFRLNQITFRVPPLRERSEDIQGLATHFIQMESPWGKFSPEASEVMKGYYWPGNVRELQNVIVRAVFHSEGGGVIELRHIWPYLMSSLEASEPESTKLMPDSAVFPKVLPTFQELEAELVRESLRRSRGKLSQAAKMLHINRHSLNYKINRLGLVDFVKTLKGENIEVV